MWRRWDQNPAWWLWEQHLHCPLVKTFGPTIIPKEGQYAHNRTGIQSSSCFTIKGCLRLLVDGLFQVTIPWIIFLTISWSLFWCFHNFSSWKVCSCELCLCFILSRLSALTLVPGRLSTRTLSQLGVNLVGTANRKNASSHRVTSKGRWENQGDLLNNWIPRRFTQQLEA